MALSCVYITLFCVVSSGFVAKHALLFAHDRDRVCLLRNLVVKS